MAVDEVKGDDDVIGADEESIKALLVEDRCRLPLAKATEFRLNTYNRRCYAYRS